MPIEFEDLFSGEAYKPPSPPNLSTVPVGVKDSSSYRKTIARGNKRKLDNEILRAYLKSQGIDIDTSLEEMNQDSTLEKVFKALDYPASLVRWGLTGVPPEEGNQLTPIIKNALKTPRFESDKVVPSASFYKTGKMNPMAIDPEEVELIPGTNIKQRAGDLFNKARSDMADPNWWANKGAEAAGLSLDILTDPITWTGPGVGTKVGGQRRMLTATTPALTKSIGSKTLPVSPKVLDQMFFKGIDKGLDFLGNTRVGRVIGKALIPGFGLPKDYYLLHRDALDKTNFAVNTMYKRADEAFKGLSDDELKTLSHYVEGSLSLDDIPEGSRDMIEEAADTYRGMMRNLTATFRSKGLITQEFDPEYVPHIYPGLTDQNQFRSGAQMGITEDRPFFSKMRKHSTLMDSLDAGNKPLENLNDIFKEYAASGLTEGIKRDFISKASESFGQKVNSVSEAYRLTKADPNLGVYIPRGTLSFHNEKGIPGGVLEDAMSRQAPGSSMIEIDLRDLKDIKAVGNKPVYLMPREVAKDMSKLDKVFGSEEATNKILNMYDRFTSWWKGRVTVTSPGFHLRNAYSNLTNAYLGGMEDFGRFMKAKDVAMGKEGTFAGKKYKDIMTLAERYGVYSPTAGHWMREIFGPEVMKKATSSDLLNPLATKFGPVEVGRKVGSAIENNARLALFMDRLAKGDSAIQASLHVKKYLFDYSELTNMERGLFRRVIPFYTWMRKNVPLQVEGLIQNPKVAAQVGKLVGVRYGEDEQVPMDMRPPMLRSPMSRQIGDDEKTPTFAKFDFPMSDLTGDISIGIHPALQIIPQVASLVFGEDEADRPAPALFNAVWEQMPEPLKDAVDLPQIKDRNSDLERTGMDPRLYKTLQNLAPFFSKVSRIMPTEENLADPNYETRLSSYFTGIPIQMVDLKKQKAIRELMRKAIMEKELVIAIKEGKINPAGLSFVRRLMKLNP